MRYNISMIPRYTTPEMAAIWSPETKFKNWLEIEAAAADAMAEIGMVPDGTGDKIRAAKINVKRIDEIEAETRHDVIAFLTSVTEQIGDAGKHMHVGMTSSDVVDTGFSMLLRTSGAQIRERLTALLSALETRINEHRQTICIGRSHGIHAEPTTFGLKLAGHYMAFKRCLKRLDAAIEEISICALSGPVGTHATCAPDIQARVATSLNLKPEIISTQVIPRDRHAAYFSVLGIIAGAIENLSTEIRHLQRSEVREVEEFFHGKQKGSSAMPHKRNPVLTENLTGLARVIRAAVIPAFENITLWHERDISHSSVERTILPDAIMACDFALYRLTGVIENLIVYPDRMRENMDALGGLIYSQKILLALIEKGLNREEAYKIVQDNAFKVWDSSCKTSFIEFLSEDERVVEHLSKNDIQKLCRADGYLIHIDGLINSAIKTS
jgi:adenylosuccinate lyase